MRQVDWVDSAPTRPARVIRDTRDAVAEEEKARLCEKLRVLMRSVPSALKTGGSINDVREFKRAVDNAHKVYSNQRSSVLALEEQLNTLRMHYSVEDLLRLSVG